MAALLASAAVTGYLIVSGIGAAASARDPHIQQSKTTSGANVTPGTPEPARFPTEIFSQPFVDGREVASVAGASGQLAFHANAPASLGAPVSVFVHADYRPQALALVYQHPTRGRFVVTEEQIDMSEDVQRQALETMASTCDPATGCVGSWTMHDLSNGNRALLISDPPNVNAVVWIHSGGIRYQLMGPAGSFSVAAALAVADVIERAAA